MVLGTMTWDLPAEGKIQNLDIADLDIRMKRIMEEVSRCASATRDEVSTHDLARCREMFRQWMVVFELHSGEPELDLPKYHPKMVDLAPVPDINKVQNSHLQHLLNLCMALSVELTWCDSAERATGFKQADINRVKPMIEKIGKHLDLVEANPEIDMPDVDKQEPGANPGNPV